MPLMVEPLAMKPGEARLRGQRRRRAHPALVRQAVELGADVIKADPTDDLDDYPSVIEVAGARPVLVRGGGRASDEEVLAPHRGGDRAGRGGHRLRAQRDPARATAEMTRALMAIVHDGARPTRRSRRGG